MLIGASTGGPGLIESIVSSLPSGMEAALVIAQHMDRISLESFAKRVGRISGLNSTLVTDRCLLEKGKIYILSDTALLHTKGGRIELAIEREKSGFYHPTIDRLFESAARIEGTAITAILLSGIGRDGAKGMHELKTAGHRTIAQDEKSSIVYGMPKAAAEMGAASIICPIEEIIAQISESVEPVSKTSIGGTEKIC